MVSIYNSFHKESIEINDNYSGPVEPICIENMFFQVGKSSEISFITNVGVKDNKVQSITNKQFYYIPEILGGVAGHEYSKELKSVYESIVQTPKEDTEHISTPVFYFLDFESLQGSVHSYDICFYLLYYYKKFGFSFPLLVPNTTQPYINSLYTLLEDYYHVQFMRIDYNKTYIFDKVYCVRSYMNIFLEEVKEFINRTLIDPILEKYKDTPTYSIIAKLKINKNQTKNTKDIILNRSVIFEESSIFNEFCSEKNIFLIDENISEELKIYYMNKANYVMLSWGSIYYIYTAYYLKNTDNTFLSILFHKNIMSERRFLNQDSHSGIYYQYSTDNLVQNIYNKIRFRGEVIDNLEMLEDFLEKTVLKSL